jgi:hypothetical protein
MLVEEYRLLNSSLHSFLPSCVTSSLLGPNILINTLSPNIISLRSSLNVSHQVSHPDKTTGKIIVLYILTFIFFDSKLKDKIFLLYEVKMKAICGEKLRLSGCDLVSRAKPLVRFS